MFRITKVVLYQRRSVSLLVALVSGVIAGYSRIFVIELCSFEESHVLIVLRSRFRCDAEFLHVGLYLVVKTVSSKGSLVFALLGLYGRAQGLKWDALELLHYCASVVVPHAADHSYDILVVTKLDRQVRSGRDAKRIATNFSLEKIVLVSLDLSMI